jgi:hypothetical protein
MSYLQFHYHPVGTHDTLSGSNIININILQPGLYSYQVTGYSHLFDSNDKQIGHVTKNIIAQQVDEGNTLVTETGTFYFDLLGGNINYILSYSYSGPISTNLYANNSSYFTKVVTGAGSLFNKVGNNIAINVANDGQRNVTVQL